MKFSSDYDAVVVGSGPNGLAAGITLQQAGLKVLLLEGNEKIGGGLRTAELTLPGFRHDICSAIHPMAVSSPFFRQQPLESHGLTLINPDVAAAHPFDDGTAAGLYQSLETTAASLGIDASFYREKLARLMKIWPDIVDDILSPLKLPAHPISFASFGLDAILPATVTARQFKTPFAKGLWAGMAAHAIQPLSNISTSAIGMVLLNAAHSYGWPFPKGGSQFIADALASYFQSLGGHIITNFYVGSLQQLPAARAMLFDVTPRQLLQIGGLKFSSVYEWQLQRYRYGMGVFKIDWALDAPAPFTSDVCRQTAMLHLGNTFEEIAANELSTSRGMHPERPFVLFSQPSVFDGSRAPAGKHTAWAYCHVPNGSDRDMTDAIENQVERFAPGFKERILARHTMNTTQLQAYNPNYVGGDINGGIIDIRQLFTRPALRASPYKTSAKGIYICSSSTPPGSGVHGMCGFHAAKKALATEFNIR